MTVVAWDVDCVTIVERQWQEALFSTVAVIGDVSFCSVATEMEKGAMSLTSTSMPRSLVMQMLAPLSISFCCVSGTLRIVVLSP